MQLLVQLHVNPALRVIAHSYANSALQNMSTSVTTKTAASARSVGTRRAESNRLTRSVASQLIGSTCTRVLYHIAPAEHGRVARGQSGEWGRKFGRTWGQTKIFIYKREERYRIKIYRGKKTSSLKNNCEISIVSMPLIWVALRTINLSTIAAKLYQVGSTTLELD